jgi:small neutral amino acid transporter SnatA (MarC family)
VNDKSPTAMSRSELEAAVSASRAVAVVPVQQATVVGPTTAETVAAGRSMRPSWQRVEAWLIVGFQAYITWLGVIAGNAIVDKFIASETVEATEMLAAIGVLSATVGAIPYLYLKARIGERKEVAQEASPIVMVNRPGKPPANGGAST